MSRLILIQFLVSAASAFSQPELEGVDDLQWVNLRTAAPGIAIDLRYAGAKNLAHRPLYPETIQPLVRAGVARRLIEAHIFLRHSGYGLKIWDAYRPREAQAQLWQSAPNEDYVANPSIGAGSLHTWGVAVDATLVDNFGGSPAMPTDFDDFTPAAMLRYTGTDALVRTHLFLLQSAMARAGFFGLRTEWWHFTASDWQRYLPAHVAKLSSPTDLSRAQ